MAKSKAEQAEVAARRVQLIRLRRQGISFDDPRVLALGYSSRGHASKDLIRALQERRDEQEAEVSVYRQEENERLDALLEAVWPDAQTGDLRAVETVLKLMDRRAKLNGLDMPVKAEVSGPEGGALALGPVNLAQLHKLIGTAGDGEDDLENEDPGDDSDRTQD